MNGISAMSARFSDVAIGVVVVVAGCWNACTGNWKLADMTPLSCCTKGVDRRRWSPPPPWTPCVVVVGTAIWPLLECMTVNDEPTADEPPPPPPVVLVLVLVVERVPDDETPRRRRLAPVSWSGSW